MKILITGINGFVGTAIAEAFSNHGCEVVGVDMDASTDPFPHGKNVSTPRIRKLRYDILDASMRELIADEAPNVVIHTAAVTPSATNQFDTATRTLEVNCLGTANILQAAAEANVPRLLLLSSASVYSGIGKAGALLEHEAQTAPQTIYGISKLASEQLGLLYDRQGALDVCCLRIGSVFGPWERDTGHRMTLSPMYQIMKLYEAGEPIILPRPGKRDWLYSRDLGRAIVLIAERTRLAHNLYNMAGEEQWTVLEWCRALRHKLPDLNFRLATDGIRPNVDFHSGADRNPLAIDRIRSEIGALSQCRIEETANDFIEWWQDHCH